MAQRETDGTSHLNLGDLLELSKLLERCWTLGDILDAVAPTVDRVLGYPHSWLAVFGETPGLVTVISHATAEGNSIDLLRRSQAIEIPIAGDPFLAEILKADHIVVVEDAPEDPRTNKDVVAALGNRTIINVPLVLADQILGTLGLGTFGDEGVRPPASWHLEFLGMIAGHVAVALDRVKFLDQRRRIAAALEQEKEHLRVTLESIGDAVIATDLEGLVTRMNAAACRLTGWTALEAEGRLLTEVFRIVNTQTRQEAQSPLARVLAEGDVVGMANHTTLVSRGGIEYQIADSAAPIRNGRGELIGVVMVFRDVTEDYALREELRRTSALLEQTAAAAKIGGWEWDVGRRQFHWSQEALRMLRFSDPDSSDWSSVTSLVDPATRLRFEGEVRSLLGQARPLNGEWKLEPPGAPPVWVGIQGFPVVDNGVVVRAYGTIQDRTTPHRAEEQRRELVQNLNQASKMASLGLLAGGVAHDMNNMLAAISGVAAVQNLAAAQDSPARNAFGTILKAVDRGRSLTQSLLAYTRNSSSSRGPVDWNALVEEAQALLAHTTFSQIELVCRLESGLPPIEGDASALGQVLMNLCINSVDAMESVPGGRRLTLTTRTEGPRVVVEVEDTGPGMTPAVLARAREPFFTTKAPGRGTGLGLALASTTVDAHGGSFEITSEAGRGTTVRLSFPLSLPSVMVSSQPRPETSAAATSVLVVDDDDLVRGVTLALVQTLGLRAIGVSRAEAALDHLDTVHGCDLVMLDVNMPGLGGLAAFRVLQDRHPGLAVVLTTGLATPEVTELVARTPGLRLLTKPFGWTELQQVLGLPESPVVQGPPSSLF